MSAFGVGVDRAHTPRARTGTGRIGSGAWHSAGSCRAPAAPAAPRRHAPVRVLVVHPCPVRPRFPTAPATRSRTQDTRPAPDIPHRSSDTRQRRPATARSNPAAGDADTPRESTTQHRNAHDARLSSTGHPASPIPQMDTGASQQAPDSRPSSQDYLGDRGRPTETGNDNKVVLCSSTSSLRLAGRAGRVSRRSATRTTAVLPTSLTVWPAGSWSCGGLWGIPCHTRQTRNRRCSVECVDVEECDRTGGDHHGWF
jgi:hypothetical protein